MRSIAVFLSVLVLAAPAAHGSDFLNLDFEHSTPSGQARPWYLGGAGYEVVVDTTTAMSGENSVRIRCESGERFGVGTLTFPLDSALGREVRYTGYIKTEGVTDGYAGLWWRVDGPGQRNMLAFDNMDGRGATGTTDWTRHEIELSVDTLAVNINFGVLLTGKGTAWFDALAVELDEEAYKDSLAPGFVPDEEQLAWIRESAIPLDTDDPSAPHDDIVPLKALVGDARIVALGEGTHGTREFFRMKHRITEFLASEMGFTVFAIEANMPEARRVNDYVLRDEGDPKEALAGLYFWTWNTEEVLAMIEWMRVQRGRGRAYRVLGIRPPDSDGRDGGRRELRRRRGSRVSRFSLGGVRQGKGHLPCGPDDPGQGRPVLRPVARVGDTRARASAGEPRVLSRVVRCDDG